LHSHYRFSKETRPLLGVKRSCYILSQATLARLAAVPGLIGGSVAVCFALLRICFSHRPTIKPSKYCSAIALGCSSARGWIQFILLVILVARGLILRLWGSYVAAFLMRVSSLTAVL
jgi:hypothetical protein